MTTLIIDEAWTKADPASIRASGYSGIIGYFSTDPSKNLTPGYVATAISNGLTVDAVWETTGTEFTGGFQAGVSDAQQANDQADVLGMPATSTIYYAIDTQATADQTRAYFQGCDSVGRRPVGAYGDIAVVDPLKADGTVKHTWQTAAWSGGQVSATADLYQRITPSQPPIVGVPSSAYDEDVVLPAANGDWGQWPRPVGPPITPAQAKEDNMKVFQWNEEEHVVGVDGSGNLVHRWWTNATGQWSKEVRATGCVPYSRVDVDTTFNLACHIYAQRTDGSMQHSFYNPEASPPAWTDTAIP